MFGIGCLLWEICFDSEMSGTGLMCSSLVVIYSTAVSVSLVSKWGKSWLWIEPLGGETLTTELDLYLLPSGGTSRHRVMKLDL